MSVWYVSQIQAYHDCISEFEFSNICQSSLLPEWIGICTYIPLSHLLLKWKRSKMVKKERWWKMCGGEKQCEKAAGFINNQWFINSLAFHENRNMSPKIQKDWYSTQLRLQCDFIKKHAEGPLCTPWQKHLEATGRCTSRWQYKPFIKDSRRALPLPLQTPDLWKNIWSSQKNKNDSGIL